MCRVLTEKCSSPAIQVLLRKATILDRSYSGSIEEDDVKHQLVQELVDIKGPEESGEGTSGESCSKALTTATAPTKKKRLSDLLQNRKANLTSQTQASFLTRVQVDTDDTDGQVAPKITMHLRNKHQLRENV